MSFVLLPTVLLAICEAYFEQKRKSKYLYIIPVSTVLIVFYESIYHFVPMDTAFNIISLFFPLCAVALSSLFALSLSSNEYHKWFLSSIFFFGFITALIFLAPIHDVTAGGMWGYEKKNIGIVGAFLYGAGALLFFGYDIYKNNFAKK
ncbi:MAG: hypothetical protein RI911_391 [Candidatus Parcubacteria bacterium]